jgi:hypothetical protein
MSTTSHEPAFRVFSVIKREGQPDFWLSLGAAFPHQNGEGYNVILQALPLPNGDGIVKLVLRPPKDDQQQDDDRPAERDRSSRKPGQQRR